jgi:hypothetical protein
MVLVAITSPLSRWTMVALLRSMSAIPDQEPVQVTPGDPILGRCLGDSELIGDDLEDDNPMLRHE